MSSKWVVNGIDPDELAEEIRQKVSDKRLLDWVVRDRHPNSDEEMECILWMKRSFNKSHVDHGSKNNQGSWDVSIWDLNDMQYRGVVLVHIGYCMHDWWRKYYDDAEECASDVVSMLEHISKNEPKEFDWGTEI